MLLSSALFQCSGLNVQAFNFCPQRVFLLIRLLHTNVIERSSTLPAFQHFGTRFLYPTVMNCYATVTNPIRQLSAPWDSYEFYPTVIKSMWQLSALSGSFDLYLTVICSIRQLSSISNSYWLYTTVTYPIRQLLALCDSY